MKGIASEIHSQAEIKQIVTIVRNLVPILKIHRDDSFV